MKTTHSTVPKLLRNIVSNVFPDTKTFLVEKKNDVWHEISFRQTLDIADAISAYFLQMGLKKGDRLGLIIENSPEYIYFDQALQQIGCINVSIYPSLSSHEIEYILNDSGIKAILVGTPFLFKKILKVANSCPELQRIIPVFDNFEKYMEAYVLNAGVIQLSSVIEEGAKCLPKLGKKINACREAVLPSDISALIYTSGTTGIPKGVMLTHSNFIANLEASLEQIYIIEYGETILSFLPFSHVFERTTSYYLSCMRGFRLVFAESLELLAKNMGEAQPTMMACVPRLLERIHEKTVRSVTAAGGRKEKLFNWALQIGQQYRETVEQGRRPSLALSAKRMVANKLVFNRIKQSLGGKLKFLFSGGAALPKAIGEFYGKVGIKVLEGYGLTETSPIISITEYDRNIYGTVGRIITGIEVGIQDVETQKIYTVQTHESFNPAFESPEGEIIVRGHCVMKGYWNKPEETALVIDAEGWFHSGDIGQFQKGNLKITDRIKNILVNSYGKNIYPTPVENTYLKSKKIDQIFLIGDKREYITAFVVPSREELQEAFKLTEEFFKAKETFINDEEIIAWIAKDIKRLSNELSKFERIKNFKVKRLPFSMEAGELTPSLKAKRKVIEKKYAEDINAMYQETANEF